VTHPSVADCGTFHQTWRVSANILNKHLSEGQETISSVPDLGIWLPNLHNKRVLYNYTRGGKKLGTAVFGSTQEMFIAHRNWNMSGIYTR
jgi:hypothetical protein